MWLVWVFIALYHRGPGQMQFSQHLGPFWIVLNSRPGNPKWWAQGHCPNAQMPGLFLVSHNHGLELRMQSLKSMKFYISETSGRNNFPEKKEDMCQCLNTLPIDVDDMAICYISLLQWPICFPGANTKGENVNLQKIYNENLKYLGRFIYILYYGTCNFTVE